MNSHRKGIVAYLLIAFGLAWAGFETIYRVKGLSKVTVLAPVALSAYAPAIACFIVRKWVTREGFADAGLRLHLRKWPYYLVAWLLPVAVMACVVILAPLFRAGTADFSLERGFQYMASLGKPVPAWTPHSLLPLLCLLLVSAVLGAPISFGEEFGWRGYLQLRLFPNNPALSAVGTGVIWGLWHFPAAIRGFGYPDNPIVGALIMYPIFGIVFSIIFGWLVQKTGSIWSSSLAHAATNNVGGNLSTLLFAGGASFLYASIRGILGLIPLAALSAWIVFTGQLKPAAEAFE
jgi:membrane protease YdiL (CAAX protease family)